MNVPIGLRAYCRYRARVAFDAVAVGDELTYLGACRIFDRDRGTGIVELVFVERELRIDEDDAEALRWVRERAAEAFVPTAMIDRAVAEAALGARRAVDRARYLEADRERDRLNAEKSRARHQRRHGR